MERGKLESAEKTISDLNAKLDIIKSSHGRAMEEAKATYQVGHNRVYDV
jgi:hypothetical protein